MELHKIIENSIRKFMDENFPDLKTAHYSVFAKVSKVYPDSEYVDIQILKKDMSVDRKYSEIPRVKTNNRHILNEVKSSTHIELQRLEYSVEYAVGDIVRVGFYYNDLSMPYIDGKVD